MNGVRNERRIGETRRFAEVTLVGSRWANQLLRVLAVSLAIGAFPTMLVAAQDATPTSIVQYEIAETFVLPEIPLASLQNEALSDFPIADDRGMFLGGIGSDLWQGPEDADNEFWLVTDRGPNGEVDVEDETRRTFPVPDFTPLILHVRAQDGTLEILEAVPVLNADGAPVTGLSNLADADEKPYDYSAQTPLEYNQDGLDVEGLVRTSSGEFWLADEYRPSLVKVGADGKVIARYVPEGAALPEAGSAVEDTLPAIYGMRKGNRGFEGLALSGDEQTLYAVLQSPLLNPDEETGEASRFGRILAINTATGEPTAEYVYEFDAAHEFDSALDEGDQDELKLSGIIAADKSTLLVLERTDEVARIYAVDLSSATDILGTEWDDPATSRSLEGLDDLATSGVTPLAKTLMVDLDALPEMPNKIEGIALVDDQTLAVVNDNDFDIGTFDESGRHEGDGTPSQLLTIRTS